MKRVLGPGAKCCGECELCCPEESTAVTSVDTVEDAALEDAPESVKERKKK